MTATFVQIPLAIGAGAARLAGRAALWGADRFMQSPMAATGLMLVTGLTLMAGTNALFLQDGRHPAPMFGGTDWPAQASTPAPIAPVVVAPETVPQRPAGETAAPVAQPAASAPVQTASAPAPETPQVVGNQDIGDLQSKLQAMGLFDGTVDGFYGPKTADAIRAFEARFGLPRTGAATPQVMQAVKDAPLNGAQATPPAPQPTPAPAPQPAPEPVAVATVDDAAPVLALMQEESRNTPSADEGRVVSDVTPQEPEAPTGGQVATAAIPPALDGDLVSDIQRGLSRLGFLQAPVNGVADEATARAIRQFQIFNNFVPTGEASPMVRDMLVAAGAYL